MILFKPEHVEPIHKRLKTQTRRHGKCRWKVSSIHQAKLNFKKGSKPFANLLIEVVREERLGVLQSKMLGGKGMRQSKPTKKCISR